MSLGSFYRSESDFLAAWHEANRSDSARLTLTQLASIEEVAKELGQRLKESKFKMFHNAGNPMLERRYGTRRYEILFRPKPSAESGGFPGFTLHTIVCDSRLLEHRQLYGNTASGQLAVLAQANAGQLAIPPGFWIWSADPFERPAGEIGSWIEDHVVPWFRMIEDAMEAPVDFLLGRVSHVPKNTALEMMLIVYGKEEAGKQLRKVLRSDPALAEAIETGVGSSEIGLLAALVSQFQLLNTAF